MSFIVGPVVPKSGLDEAEYDTENVGYPFNTTVEHGRSVPRNHLPIRSESCVAEEPTARLPRDVDEAAPPVQVAFAALPLTRAFIAHVKYEDVVMPLLR